MSEVMVFLRKHKAFEILFEVAWSLGISYFIGARFGVAVGFLCATVLGALNKIARGVGK